MSKKYTVMSRLVEETKGGMVKTSYMVIDWENYELTIIDKHTFEINKDQLIVPSNMAVIINGRSLYGNPILILEKSNDGHYMAMDAFGAIAEIEHEVAVKYAQNGEVINGSMVRSKKTRGLSFRFRIPERSKSKNKQKVK